MGSWLKIPISQLLTQELERLERNPVNAINRTGIDRFLNAIRAVTILTNRPRAPEIGLHHKRVAGDMSAIPTSDADGLVNPDRPISKGSPQNRFTPCSGALFL